MSLNHNGSRHRSRPMVPPRKGNKVPLCGGTLFPKYALTKEVKSSTWAEFSLDEGASPNFLSQGYAWDKNGPSHEGTLLPSYGITLGQPRRDLKDQVSRIVYALIEKNGPVGDRTLPIGARHAG